jgi:hypothetical protein
MSLPNRLFRSSQVVKMRGTIAFERLSCPAAAHNSTYGYDAHNNYNSTTPEQTFMRIRINEVVYPIVDCTNGPGFSCPLSQYQSIIKAKREEAGDVTKLCNITDVGLTPEPKATFFFDNTLPWQSVIKP